KILDNQEIFNQNKIGSSHCYILITRSLNHKAELLNLAEELGNVSKSCKISHGLFQKASQILK
ncbi:MAG: hypothetical protein KAH20_14125, partial [Methylococcales bacterium]|nr:hypothetical protein [Methylococcales bacterium]